MESNHLNKPVYRLKKKTICENNDKHKEQEKNKHEDVKKDIKIIKRREEEQLNLDHFLFRICLSLYDYQAKARTYRKGLTY